MAVFAFYMGVFCIIFPAGAALVDLLERITRR